jgi:3D (Asp-Asp-Asp) domain-containing protein
MRGSRTLRAALYTLALLALPAAACASTPPSQIPTPTPHVPKERMMSATVTATAYNSLAGQADHTPNVAAWGDQLKPGMKAIAVSRDLLSQGLTRGMRVKIEGLEGEYVVLDRMPSRWSKRIDIYMGEDVRAARNWGVREVQIRWTPVD